MSKAERENEQVVKSQDLTGVSGHQSTLVCDSHTEKKMVQTDSGVFRVICPKKHNLRMATATSSPASSRRDKLEVK